MVQCVATAMLTYHATATCIGMIVAEIETNAPISEATVLACALSAQLIHDTTKVCR